MNDDDISAEQIAAITAYVDIEAPPPAEPTAHLIFGTNQPTPAEIVADRYRQVADGTFKEVNLIAGAWR